MVNGNWFLDALTDISEFAKEEKIDGVLEGLAQALEVYAVEAGVSGEQLSEVRRILGVDGEQTAQLQNTGHRNPLES